MSRRPRAFLAVIALTLTVLAACGDDDTTAKDDGSGDSSDVRERPEREPTGVACDYPEDPRGASKQEQMRSITLSRPNLSQ